MMIIEALPKKYFNAEHLPGALNIPHDEIQEHVSLLPDKDAFIVVYCSNAACQNSTIAVNKLQQMGYTCVFEYVDGKQDWVEAGLPVESTK